MYRSVLQIRPLPHFAPLALVQSTEWAYTRDATFSLVIAPSLDQSKNVDIADAGFILALPFHHRDFESDRVGVSMREEVGGGRRVTYGIKYLCKTLC